MKEVLEKSMKNEKVLRADTNIIFNIKSKLYRKMIIAVKNLSL